MPKTRDEGPQVKPAALKKFGARALLGPDTSTSLLSRRRKEDGGDEYLYEAFISAGRRRDETQGSQGIVPSQRAATVESSNQQDKQPTVQQL